MTSAAAAVDGGALPLGGGLLSLVRPALDLLEPNGALAVLSSHPSAGDDLSVWCKLEGHRFVATEPGRFLIQKGTRGVSAGSLKSGSPLPVREGRVLAADVMAVAPFDEEIDAASGFAPRGARVEPGGPRSPVSVSDVAIPEAAALYDQAVASQWTTADIPWEQARSIDPSVERAVAQVMTFLAENELSALYVPSRFVSRLHPAFAEVALFLASQLADEARHIDVFLKRARLNGQPLGSTAVSTSRSLLSLLELEDFVEASFLLSVLGEGTFLDLLAFIERHAPDAATAEIAKRARIDEARHVHFGMAHVRHALKQNSAIAASLEAAISRRSAKLGDVTSVPPALQDALVILAAGGTAPAQIARGQAAFLALLGEMHEHRIRRLQTAGFSAAQAEHLSTLHTPNFM